MCVHSNIAPSHVRTLRISRHPFFVYVRRRCYLPSSPRLLEARLQTRRRRCLSTTMSPRQRRPPTCCKIVAALPKCTRLCCTTRARIMRSTMLLGWVCVARANGDDCLKHHNGPLESHFALRRAGSHKCVQRRKWLHFGQLFGTRVCRV